MSDEPQPGPAATDLAAGWLYRLTPGGDSAALVATRHAALKLYMSNVHILLKSSSL